MLSQSDSNDIFNRNRKRDYKISMESQKTLNSRAITWKKIKTGVIMLPGFKLCLKVMLIKTVWQWHKKTHRPMGRNREPRINCHICAQLLFDTGAMNMQWEEDNLLKKRCWDCITTAERWNWALFTPLIEIEFKWIKDLNVCVCSAMSDSLWPTETVARQTPLSIEFFRQKYWSGLPFPALGALPIQGSNLGLLDLLNRQADSLPLHHLGSLKT